MGSDEREVSARRRIHQTGTGSVAFEADRSGRPFWKVRNPSAQKIFYFDQTFLLKKGGLALGWSRQIKQRLQWFARFKKSRSMREGL
jgi:hypothetical protein